MQKESKADKFIIKEIFKSVDEKMRKENIQKTIDGYLQTALKR